MNLLSNGAWDSEANIERKMLALGFSPEETFSAAEILEAHGYLQSNAYLLRIPYGRASDSYERVYASAKGGITTRDFGVRALPLFEEGV